MRFSIWARRFSGDSSRDQDTKGTEEPVLCLGGVMDGQLIMLHSVGPRLIVPILKPRKQTAFSPEEAPAYEQQQYDLVEMRVGQATQKLYVHAFNDSTVLERLICSYKNSKADHGDT